MFMEYVVPSIITLAMGWFAWESSLMVDEKKKGK